MSNNQLFDDLKIDLANKIHLLEDKPEETVETTLKALWFKACGIPVSAARAEQMILPDLNADQITELKRLIDIRLNNTPLAHITGRQNFMGIELLSDKRALIPRKETEILGKKALELSQMAAKGSDQIKIVDACCGSGNLGIAVAYLNPLCRVFATDISEEAVALTRDNINHINLADRIQAFQGDLLSAFESPDFYGEIDLLICNPPYISSGKVQKMETEISSNEPSLAFDGGTLGIKVIQRLITDAPKFLKPEAWLIFEVGAGQGDFIIKLCERSKMYHEIRHVNDDAGIIRVVLAQKSHSAS